MAGKRVPLGHKGQDYAARANGGHTGRLRQAGANHSARQHYANRLAYAQKTAVPPAAYNRPGTGRDGMHKFGNGLITKAMYNPAS